MVFRINLFRFECAVEYEPKEFVDEHERKLWENLALDKWPTKLYELVKGTNTESFGTLFTTIETCKANV